MSSAGGISGVGLALVSMVALAGLSALAGREGSPNVSLATLAKLLEQHAVLLDIRSWTRTNLGSHGSAWRLSGFRTVVLDLNKLQTPGVVTAVVVVDPQGMFRIRMPLQQSPAVVAMLEKYGGYLSAGERATLSDNLSHAGAVSAAMRAIQTMVTRDPRSLRRMALAADGFQLNPEGGKGDGRRMLRVLNHEDPQIRQAAGVIIPHIVEVRRAMIGLPVLGGALVPAIGRAPLSPQQARLLNHPLATELPDEG